MNQSKVFLEAMCSGKPDELFLLLWTLPEKDSHWFRIVEDAIRYAGLLSGHDLYVGVGLAGHDYGLKQRCKSDEIAGIIGLWADLDLRSAAHPKPTLPATIEQALSILPPEFPPSIVVRTGNGVHIWWLFKEPWIFASAEDRQAAAAFVSRWHMLLRDNASQRGWTYERLADLARVLRVPGTTNCKDPVNPKPVVIYTQTDLRYNPSDLTEYLNEFGVADEETHASAAREWAKRFRDTPIDINLAARIPDDVLNRWLEENMQFGNTWFRQRHDLHDQSQSGYDLALCNFGFRKGLSEQQVVDLVIHHRALHKQKQRTRIDYYHRTLAKAAEAGSGVPDATRSFGWGTGCASSDPVSAPADDTDGATASPSKTALCRRLSKALGIEILRMVKISGSEPFYRMETAVGKMEFATVAKLINQPAVRTSIAAAAGKLMPKFKSKLWEEIAQFMLDACIVEDGGEELEAQGAAHLCLREYLAETGFIPSIAGQSRHDLRKPVVRNDQIAVCASDFQLYLNKTRSQSISVQAVVTMLSAAGAKVERVRGKFKEQSRWLLPLDYFDPAEHSTPDMGQAEHG